VNKQAPLPDDEIRFLRALSPEQQKTRLKALWEIGWSLSTLANSVDPVRPKSTMHFWVRNAPTTEHRRSLPPAPPSSLTTATPTKSAPRLRTISPGVPPDLKPKIRALSELSRRYRAKTRQDSAIALANQELTVLAKSLRDRGVPTAAIAQAAGVTYRAMAKRLSQ
jgi:hypothetical protein